MKNIRYLVTLDVVLEPRQSGIQVGRVFAGLTMTRPERNPTYNCIILMIYIVIILLCLINIGINNRKFILINKIQISW